MKRKGCFLLCCALLAGVLAGCARPGAPDGIPVSVYYVRDGNGYGLLAPERVYVSAEDEIWTQALDAVLQPPRDDGLRTVFPAGTRIEEARLEDRTAEISLSSEAQALQGIYLTMARACLVLTLTGLDIIDGVRLRFGGGADAEGAETPPILRAEDFVLGSLVRPGAEHDYICYFADSMNRHIVPEIRNLVLRDGQPAEEYIFGELATQPQTAGLRPVIPEGTALLSISTENNICTVNLSSEFVQNAPGDAASARMTLSGITASLTALPHIAAVQILIEGQPLSRYHGWILDGPMTADPFAARGMADGAPVALWVPVDGGLLPVWLPVAGHGEMAALDALADTPPIGAIRVFPEGVRVLDVIRRGTQYTVTLSEEFTQLRPLADPWLVIQSIAHTLDGFTPGASVRLTVGDDVLTSYFGLELPEVLTADPEALLEGLPES